MSKHVEKIIRLANEYQLHKDARTEQGELMRWAVHAVRNLDLRDSDTTAEEVQGYEWLKAKIGKEVFNIYGGLPPEPEWVTRALDPNAAPPLKTVTVELVVRTQVPEGVDLQHLAVNFRKVRLPLREGALQLDGTAVVGYPTRDIEAKHLTYQWRITEGDYTLSDAPYPMSQRIAEAQKVEPKELHHDEWLMAQISKTLDAVRNADHEGLETELDMIAFAETVLGHYNKPKEDS